MTNDEINRKISEARDEWFEVVDEWDHNGRTTRSHSSPLDWTGSEDASAVLLEEMPNPHLCKYDDSWSCDPDHTEDKNREADHADRKVAIALAWLKWKGLT